ncbi:hypothetical protein HOLleu_25943 [Holothuria leucospilota]|uniref:Uncharacterized protein n=1 Tax=Holothuria leucospilota TaxID=206669 RepID=A0A9Q1BTM3_HOLLE|nr:hypothetical protein HOLleu_25943 [Holothuria leucospilota]
MGVPTCIFGWWSLYNARLPQTKVRWSKDTDVHSLSISFTLYFYQNFSKFLFSYSPGFFLAPGAV